eukprot:CAMPEP_0118685768 /NCGR_PEP_ID=MMETSP0800-20121206/7435_1 /TAXON_ID=210618 ORGANISM="Striatella unipunctata, Strain CCMP2910" /NCGR_SAMPLE_ID=MMETSP0800 /ASSEMBLY_ACC=CAM_ASM_000638 /LENGTH=99 /DNA_ID=CAMNT_0006582727 /DNA_START=164 /DNA_END=460 /DNA_ORIENTATION=+
MSARRFDEFKDPNMDGSSGGWNAEEGHLLEFFFSPTEIDSEGGLKQESSMEPPSTPAIQYYASSRSNNQPPFQQWNSFYASCAAYVEPITTATYSIHQP